MKTNNTFVDYYKKFNDYRWKELVEADKILGYYKLSNPLQGITPNQLPERKQNKK